MTGKFEGVYTVVKKQPAKKYGTASSGNYGHEGRPGSIGGSAPPGAGPIAGGFDITGDSNGYVGTDDYHSYLEAKGVTNPQVVEDVEQALNGHAGGSEQQKWSDEKLVNWYNDPESEHGQMLQALTELEGRSARAVEEHNHEAIDKQLKGMERLDPDKIDLKSDDRVFDGRHATGYDPRHEPEEYREAYHEKVADLKTERDQPLEVYRKAAADDSDRQLLPYTIHVEGASTNPITGNDQRFTPNSKMTLDELDKKGYKIISGYARQRGRSGEGEVIVIKPIKSTKSSALELALDIELILQAHKAAVPLPKGAKNLYLQVNNLFKAIQKEGRTACQSAKSPEDMAPILMKILEKNRPALVRIIQAKRKVAFYDSVKQAKRKSAKKSLTDPLAAIVKRMLAKSFTASNELMDRIERDVMETLAKGVSEGRSSWDVARMIELCFDHISPARADVIARVEINGAQNQGAYEQFQEMDVEYQQWWTAEDPRVREEHEEMHGQIVRVGQPFSNGLLYPGDTDGPIESWYLCRCTAIPYLMPWGYKAPEGDAPFYEDDIVPVDEPAKKYGTASSGNRGHEGRPGQIGGSGASWSASMSESDATAFSKGGAYEGKAWNHFTSEVAAQSIAEGGFHKSDGIYGIGVYTTGAEDAGDINRRWTDTKLQVYTRVQNPLVITSSRDLNTKMTAMGATIDDEPNEFLPKHGYDAIEIRQKNWLMVFDPHDVTVVKPSNPI